MQNVVGFVYEYDRIPAPSKGCQMVPLQGVKKTHPLGFKDGTPLKVMISQAGRCDRCSGGYIV